MANPPSASVHSSALPLPFAKAWPWTAFVALIFLVNYGSRSALSPLLVSVEVDMQVSHSQATSLLMLQGLGFSLALAFSGFVMGWVRPARVAVFSVVASGTVLLFMPQVTTLGQGQTVFFMFGLCAGMYFPAGMATLASLVFPADWGKAVGIHELAPNTGFILMPLLMQLALNYTDWRGAFTLVGAAMIIVGLSFLFFGRGGQVCTPPTSFGGSAKVLRIPRTWIFALLLSICMVGEFSIYSVLQLYLVSEGGFSPEKANVILSLSRAVTPLAVFAAGFAADAFNPVRLVRFCLLAHGIALGLMALDHTVLALSGVALQAFSIAFSFPALFKVMGNCTPLEEQPLLLSLTMPVAGLVSAGMVPWFLGFCGEFFSFGAGFLVMGIVSLLSMLPLSSLNVPKTDSL